MLSNAVRTKFLKFFKDRGHTIVPSSPVFPHNDPSILFTNAGMNQFKDIFLGKEQINYRRAATSQKCIRAGGKHNDLDNVGHTSRHLTFFEMLGNFSFGDYFKQEAIDFAWSASLDVFGFDPNKITATVYCKDDESFDLWKRHLPEKRIIRLGDKDNFWSMADIGPCGPCSELLYDRGPAFGAATSPEEDLEGERFLEYWNLVFMQYNRNEQGENVPLPKKSVDTGAGLERVVSLINERASVFDSDVLRDLIARIEMMSGQTYTQSDHGLDPCFRVIADHVRSLSFAVADGLRPGNTDRSYVIRKILRRAVNYGRRLGFKQPFLSELVPSLVQLMGGAYPELEKSKTVLQEVFHIEEENFFKTLKRGGSILNTVLENSKTSGRVSGADAFKLKDTYGLPLEEIVLLAKDNRLTVDMEEYIALELKAKEISKSTCNKSDIIAGDIYTGLTHTKFLGYNRTDLATEISAIISESTLVSEMQKGQTGILLLNETAFYPEKGGQIGDKGHIVGPYGIFKVCNTYTPSAGIIAHEGELIQGRLSIRDKVQASVDTAIRKLISTNHTACHLLHKILETILGEHIKQAGSLIDDKKLRLDFTHPKALSKEELSTIEDAVNEKIRDNISVNIYEEEYQKVIEKKDIKQFFGDKYGSVIRIVDIGFSKELCGGTHATQTGEIGFFKIIKESGIAAGIRRIEAVTGKQAETTINSSLDALYKIASVLSSPVDQLNEKLKDIINENKALNNRNACLEEQLISLHIKNLIPEMKILKGLKSFYLHLPEEKNAAIRKYAEILHTIEKHDIISLISSHKDGRCIVLSSISPNLVNKGFHANDLLQYLLQEHDGKWGGKTHMAQGSCRIDHSIILADFMEKWILTH
ncbi:MAG: alanine--tRNA ligase [Victivallaceae bacterium]